MAKNLFLEGPIRTGKSTLLKECLAPYKDVLGGFSCVRYKDEKGNILAYGLAEPCTEVDGKFDPEITPNDPSVFLLFENTCDSYNTIKRLETFETVGLDYLNCSDAKLILMDELGGIELKSEKFRDRVYELLSSDVPCIGVLKKNTGGEGILNGITNLNDEFKNDLIKKFDCEIIEFTADKIDEIRDKIDRFITS